MRGVFAFLDDGFAAAEAAERGGERLGDAASDELRVAETEGFVVEVLAGEGGFGVVEGGAGEAVAEVFAGDGDGGTDAGGRVGSAGEGDGGKRRVADVDVDGFEREAEEIGGGHGENGADTGADFVGAGFEFGVEAVGGREREAALGGADLVGYMAVA